MIRINRLISAIFKTHLCYGDRADAELVTR